MTLPLTKLKQIAEFASCRCPVSEPNMEKARQHIATLVKELIQEKEDSRRYLGLLGFKAWREHDPDMAETAQATFDYKAKEIEALKEGMGRGR